MEMNTFRSIGDDDNDGGLLFSSYLCTAFAGWIALCCMHWLKRMQTVEWARD